MKIYAPVKDFNGLRNNVRFKNGVGETNDLSLSEWFRSHGYKVAMPVEDESPRVERTVTATLDNESALDKVLEDVETAVQPDFESMTPNELRDWAKANGLGNVIKNIRNKERLLEIVRG